MNSKEALKRIYYDAISGNEIEEDVEEIKNDYDLVKQSLDRLEKLEKELKDGTLSDGYHTFNDLYLQRMYLFATIVNQNKQLAWKSLKHEDGELCFGGDWFIVGIDTPKGSYTYHYETNYWSLFDCQELEVAKHWDGHTSKDVDRLLSLHHDAFDQLEKENKELKDELKRCQDTIKKWTNNHSKLIIDNGKMKKALDILKNGFEVILCENDFPIPEIKYSIGFKLNNDGVWIHISQEDYELFKSVLEEE